MARDNGNGSVTVVSGDTLYGIASTYYSKYGSQAGCSNVSSYANFLATRNNIRNQNLITIGQVIYLTPAGSSSNPSSSTTTQYDTKVTITKVSLMPDTERTVYAEWTFNNPYVSHYMVEWWVGSITDSGVRGVPYNEGGTRTTEKWATFDVPSQYVRANVRVLPVSKTYGDNVSYFSGVWSVMDQVDTGDDYNTQYNFGEYAAIGTPSTPNVEIKDFTLTATVNGVPDNVTQVEFQIAKDNSSSPSVFATGIVTPSTNQASYSTTVEAGGQYKARARYINANGTGSWSSWSGNGTTKPLAPAGIISCEAKTMTSVRLTWHYVANADYYTIQYTDNLDYFAGSDALSEKTTENTTVYTITQGLEAGKTYYFRVRAENDAGSSDWTEPVSCILGTTPVAPTTWSSLNMVVTGEPLTLYWVHNSEDGSYQSKAEVEVTVKALKEDSTVITLSTMDDGATITTSVSEITYDDDGIYKTAVYTATIVTEKDQYDKDYSERTMHCYVSTGQLTSGATLEWKVRTAGVTNEYGDWSILRTVNVYAPPELVFNLNGEMPEEYYTLSQFPLYVNCTSGPRAQTPVGYHLTVISNSYYETVDDIGRNKVVYPGDEIYSEYHDTTSYQPEFVLSANNIDLDNYASYTIKCVVSMDSGLTGEYSQEILVTWIETYYEPNAEIGINRDNLTALIRPYCKNANGDLIEGIRLSVYRREFDGSFTPVVQNLDNTKNSFITDPHPALDYARYRVVAITESTGAVSYADLAAYPVGEKGTVLQWEEEWSTFDVTEGMSTSDIPWSGSLLKLMYNIDISDDHKPDVSLIKYVGREHPVTYYGTQKGHTATWSVEIPKTDKETLYAVRRLASWMGDVYVREPSGTGYWANVTVSYSQTHLSTIIPIKLTVTRVEGGV